MLSATGAGALLGMVLMLTLPIERNARLILTVGASTACCGRRRRSRRGSRCRLFLLFALGATDGMWGVSRNTLAQLLVPDALRGRVMSVVMLVTRGSSQLGQVQAGCWSV